MHTKNGGQLNAGNRRRNGAHVMERLEMPGGGATVPVIALADEWPKAAGNGSRL